MTSAALCLSLFLEHYTRRLDYDAHDIFLAVTVLIGAYVTRIAAVRLKINSLLY